MDGWDLAAFALTTAMLLGGSFIGARSAQTFLVADRRVGFFPLTATLVMTEFNTATLLAFAAVGYRAGPRAIGLSAVFLIGLLWYTFTVARKWKQYNGLSVAGWFTQRYGSALGRTVAVLLLLAMLGFSATYVKSITLLAMPALAPISPWVTSGVLCLLIAFVTASGGLASVVRLDVLSFLLTLVLLPTLLAVGWWRHDGLDAWRNAAASGDPLSSQYWLRWDDPQLPWSFVISLVALTCLTYICAPWYGQKIFAAVSERTAVLSVAAASVIIFLLYGAAQVAASLFAAEPGALTDPQLCMPQMLQSWLPVGLRGIGFAVFLAVSTTTLAGVWSAMVAMAVSDFGGKWTERVEVQRAMTVLFATASWMAGNLLVDDILSRLILTNIPVAALAFALLGGFHWTGASRAGAWTSIVIGSAWGVFTFGYWGEAGGYTWYWTIFGIPLIFGSGVVASRLFPDANRSLDARVVEILPEASTDQRRISQSVI